MSETTARRPPTVAWGARFLVVVLLAGVGAGLGAAVLSLLLHSLEFLAYGRSETPADPGFGDVAAWRRVVALAVAGVVASVGWWALHRWGSPIVSVAKAVAGGPMKPVSTLIHAVLQIIIVGLGASVGREVAPRELGALVSGWLSDRAGLSARERRIIVAAGAGAGLAGVYSVPLGGALFALEILLAEVSVMAMIATFGASAVATLVASIAVPQEATYLVPQLTLSPSLVVFSVLIGPFAGAASWLFLDLVRRAEGIRPKGPWILIVMPVVFTLLGVLSIVFPDVLGNGRAAAEFAFVATGGLGLTLVLLVLKPIATAAVVGAGGYGGTLTPSLAIGALLGLAGGIGWNALWPGVPLPAFAFVGAAALLAASLKAPVTALVLVLEFSRQGYGVLVPMMIAIGGAMIVQHYLGRRAPGGAAVGGRGFGPWRSAFRGGA